VAALILSVLHAAATETPAHADLDRGHRCATYQGRVTRGHFHNQANTGPNEGAVNTPQRERGFAFVLTPADYRRAAAAVDTLLWGEHPQAEREQALTTLEGASRGHGTLRITAMTLGNLVPGAQAWFETLDLDAELCRPP
jgi:hypothetical protein